MMFWRGTRSPRLIGPFSALTLVGTMPTIAIGTSVALALASVVCEISRYEIVDARPPSLVNRRLVDGQRLGRRGDHQISIRRQLQFLHSRKLQSHSSQREIVTSPPPSMVSPLSAGTRRRH
jgi:hypothetical protein